jgi:uncharacterized membrane protein YesL
MKKRSSRIAGITGSLLVLAGFAIYRYEYYLADQCVLTAFTYNETFCGMIISTGPSVYFAYMLPRIFIVSGAVLIMYYISNTLKKLRNKESKK